MSDSLGVTNLPAEPAAPPVPRRRAHESWSPYAWGALAVALPAVVGNLTARYLQLADLLMLHLLGVVIISFRFGPRPSLFTAICSVLAFDYFFIPPRFAFALPDVKSVITFTVTLFVAAVISWLGETLRTQRVVASENQRRAETLHRLSRELAGTRDLPQLAAVLRRHLVATYGYECSVLIIDAGGRVKLGFGPCADQALRLGITPVQGKDGARVILPLRTVRDTLGIVVLEPPSTAPPLNQPDSELLQSCCDQTAVAIERALVAESLERAKVAVESERVRSSLLAAIGHDLRTPLGVILTAANTLKEHPELAADARGDLADTIANEAEHLTQLVTNVVSMAKLESDALVLQKQVEAIEDVIESAMNRCTGLAQRPVSLELDEGLPLAPMDPVLVEQLVLNLLENAVKYSPPASPLEVGARACDGGVLVTIADRGLGISEHEGGKIFEKFYRGSAARARDGGVGLGLTICRAVARAHSGTLRLRSRHAGGTVAEFWLPSDGEARAATVEHEELRS